MKSSPKVRILNISKHLFYENGYYHTGINQIIKEAGTAKASFYDYFSSKEELGIQVIRSYGKDILVWFRHILSQSNDPKQFVKVISKAVRAQIRSDISFYQGCPIAVFSCQFPVGKQPFSAEFQSIVKSWEMVIDRKLLKWKENQILPKNLNTISVSRKIINVYEGGLINWRISLDESYITQMETQIKEMLLI